ncbi:ogr/Delta-like zinc finger family protein [Comamonas faecalis]|uniref:ogr/Delta-like zinc finger family protein n=1 Tax=Comamonas faecalis TaxID=1387849 RepID=UPI003CD0C24E
MPIGRPQASTCTVRIARPPTVIRCSSETTPLLRKVYYDCTDAACGYRFLVHAAATRTLSPSAKPDPAIYLPIAEATRNAIAQHPSMSEDESGPAVRLLDTPARAPEDRHAWLR